MRTFPVNGATMRALLGAICVSERRATIRTVRALAPEVGDGMKHEQRDDAVRNRPIHHSPLFWIGVVLCLAAIVVYVMSYDLSWPVAK
ncbi:hypothetical protein CIW50_21830 [Tardiphaga sp. P9-11]|jgi:hypothetical protein|nr:hypothetical protein CIW50_21830 [Tardiphaga sp. P9-11]